MIKPFEKQNLIEKVAWRNDLGAATVQRGCSNKTKSHICP
jgi:hypothetical protein